MRTNQICHTIKNLKLNGYNVFIKALAVNELKSRSGIYQRYIKQIKSSEYARFTEQSIHDAAYTGMLETLKQIEEEKLYDELKIYKRNDPYGDLEVIFESNYKNYRKGVVEVIKKERERKWSIDEYYNYVEKNNQCIKFFIQRNEDEKYIKDIEELNKKAKQMLEEKISIRQKISDIKIAKNKQKNVSLKQIEKER